jgi:RNA polymerase sigma-70 factor (ECF subfamily)
MNDLPTSESTKPTSSVPPAGFLLQLTNHQSALYAAVVSMLGGADGAQDVLQETNAALLEKAAEFDPSRPFVAWAIGFARTQVLSWRKRQTRDRLVLDDALFEVVAEKLTTASPVANRRLEALEGCLGKLPQPSRELISDRYMSGESVQAIAERSGRTVNVVSVLLFRIRQALLDCVRKTLATEGDPR